MCNSAHTLLYHFPSHHLAFVIQIILLHSSPFTGYTAVLTVKQHQGKPASAADVEEIAER